MPDAVRETGRILIRLSPGQHTGQKSYGWVGNWPPPDRLLLVRHVPTDKYKVINPFDYPNVDWAATEREQACEVFVVVRNQLLEKGGKHAAEYTPPRSN